MAQTFSVTRKLVAAAIADDCDCKVTAVAREGKPTTQFHVHICAPEHSRLIKKLLTAAEKAAENKA